ncbi:hypothetical protein V8F20_008673 [Naviculisporaceae sp. PSN 640]
MRSFGQISHGVLLALLALNGANAAALSAAAPAEPTSSSWWEHDREYHRNPRPYRPLGRGRPVIARPPHTSGSWWDDEVYGHPAHTTSTRSWWDDEVYGYGHPPHTTVSWWDSAVYGPYPTREPHTTKTATAWWDNNHHEGCDKFPDWVYNSSEIGNFCRWIKGQPRETITITAKVQKTITRTSVVKASQTSTKTNTLTTTATLTVTPAPVTATRTYTLITGFCPTPVIPATPQVEGLTQRMRLKRGDLSSNSSPAQEAEWIQAELEDQAAQGMINYLAVSQELGPAGDDLCSCVLEHGKIPKKTVTKTITSLYSTTLTTRVTSVIKKTRYVTVTRYTQTTLPPRVC